MPLPCAQVESLAEDFFSSANGQINKMEEVTNDAIDRQGQMVEHHMKNLKFAGDEAVRQVYRLPAPG